MPDTPVAETVAVSCWFPGRRGLRPGARAAVRAVDGVSLVVNEGTTVGVIGESGSGKTTLARLLLRIHKPTEGTVLFEGQDLDTLSAGDTKAYRRHVQAVFQDPRAAFNPRRRVGAAVEEPLRVQGGSKRDAQLRAIEVLELVGLGANLMHRYPHECSGGQLQRMAIARAISASPRLVVLDEPVSSLDVSVRGQVINLLMDLRTSLGLSYVLISHELVTSRHISDEVYVMYAGKIVERGGAVAVYDEPLHPYTKLLVSSASHERSSAAAVASDEGPPDPSHLPSGCRFHPRCPVAMRGCLSHEPELTEHDGRGVACHLYGEGLPTDLRKPLRDQPQLQR